MKTLLKWVKDILLLLIILVFLLVGLWGVRLPFRSVFGETGPYQLQAFNNGLAFFHYGRGQTQFWSINPLNDFVESEAGTRSALLSQEIFNQKQFEAKFTYSKPAGIREAIMAYFGQATPWYSLSTEDLRVDYKTEKKGDGWLISRKMVFNQPKIVQNQGITLWYYGSDVVFDGQTRQAYTRSSDETLKEIEAIYGWKIIPMTLEDWTPVLSSGEIIIINPNRPGLLTVKAMTGQKLWVNRSYRLIEVVEPVNRAETNLKTQIWVSGSEGEEANGTN